ncbi:hypothetical protein F2P79_002855 [Pimephales promelas]|nr:hypothetical protein F2P79_002855 [Pimephales promelas]
MRFLDESLHQHTVMIFWCGNRGKLRARILRIDKDAACLKNQVMRASYTRGKPPTPGVNAPTGVLNHLLAI